MKKFNLPIVGKWFILGMIVGVFAGIAAIVFYSMLKLSDVIFMNLIAGYAIPEAAGDISIFPHIEKSKFREYMLIIVPVIGAVISSILVYKFAPEAEGAGTDAAISAIHKKNGHIKWKVPFVKTFSSAITIGSGGSGGGEGPISHIGAGIGSIVGRFFNLTEKEKRILTAAGMGAGVGAIFRSPLAGAILAAEVLYSSSDLEYEVLLPSTITSIIAYSIFCSVFGWEHMFASSNFYFRNPLELIGYTILGLSCIIWGYLFVKIYSKTKDIFSSLKVHKIYKPIIGALLVGIIGYFVPQSLGAGYFIIEESMRNEFTITLILIIITAKIFATSFTIGSGGSAGSFAPAMVIGASVGYLTGAVLNKILPSISSDPGAFAVVGMAGFFAGIAKTPLSTIIMVSEITGNYNLIVPAMWVSSMTFLSLKGVNLYKNQVNFRSDSPMHKGEFFLRVLQDIKVSDVMKNDPIVIREEMKFSDVVSFIPTTKHNSFPVVKEDGTLLGVLRFEEIREFVFEEGLVDLVVAGELCDTKSPHIFPDNNLADAIETIGFKNVELLPVVDRDSQKHILGIITRRDIISIYNKEMIKQKKSFQESEF